MTPYLRNPLIYVWAFLAAITITSWWIGRQQGDPLKTDLSITIGVLLIALIKSRLVISYFMEVRTSALWLRRICDGWLVALFGIMFALYFFSF